MGNKKVMLIEKLHKTSKKWLALSACVVIGLGVLGGTTFAKYYANNSNKGVTAAANFYFSSNLLGDALVAAEQIDSVPEEEAWKTVYNTNPWDGMGEYTFDLWIQNYQNQLLYNDENLKLDYKITFELLDEDGGQYYVSHNAEARTPLQKGTPLEFTELTILGGKANFDDFDVICSAPANVDENYQSARILVVAEITGPDYLAKTKRQIGGILRVGVLKADYNLSGKFDFSISSMANEWSETDLSTIQGMAAFPYEISYTAGADGAAHDVLVTWDDEWIHLNQFDEYYSKVTEGEDGKAQMVITIQPDETLELIYFRTEKFDLTQISPMDFQELITIQDLDT